MAGRHSARDSANLTALDTTVTVREDSDGRSEPHTALAAATGDPNRPCMIRKRRPSRNLAATAAAGADGRRFLAWPELLLESSEKPRPHGQQPHTENTDRPAAPASFKVSEPVNELWGRGEHTERLRM